MNISSSEFLREIAKIDDGLIQRITNNFVCDFKNYILSLDLSHPDICDLFKDFLLEDKFFLEKCFEYLKVIQYTKQNLYLNSALIFEDKIRESFRGKILNKSLNVRFLKNTNYRDELRSFKKYKKIDLHFTFNDKNFWNQYPDSFSSFSRFDNSYEKNVSEVLKQKSCFEEMGYLSLAEESQRDAEDLEKNNQMYYGFHQIKATVAAVILAKISGYSFFEDGIFVNNDICPKDPRKLFNYYPAIFPAHDAAEFLSQDFSERIQTLDSFDHVGGKPIFDHFVVVVPGYDILVKDEDCWYFNDYDGKKTFYNENNARKEMIGFFLRNKIVKSVLFGEKDGKFYFIDFIS